VRSHLPGVTRPFARTLALVALALGPGCSGREPTAVPRPSPAAPRFTVDPNAGVFAYVVNTIDAAVTVIRISDATVVKSVNAGTYPNDAPFGIAATPDGSKVFVTQRGFPPAFFGNTVTPILTSINAPLAPATVGDGPAAIAITPDGKQAYVVNSEAISAVPPFIPGTVSVFYTKDNSPVKTVTVGMNPSAIAITPKGDFAYVTNFSDNSFSVINTSTFDVQTFGLGPLSNFPSGVAINSDGSKAYVTDQLTNSVSVIETAGNSVTKTVSVGVFPQGIAISPAGFAYVTNTQSNTVSVIGTVNDAVVKTVSVGAYPNGVAFTPVGDTAYVTNYDDNTISVIRTSDNTVVRTMLGIGRTPAGIAIATVSPPAPPDPKQKIAQLQSAVSGLSLAFGTFNSLNVKLTIALDALNAGDAATACSALQDFINEATAQSGKKISTADANTLIDQATAIRTLIGC
jgi:YVTN family beta-propeller protein